jgi:hypothetical protein
MRFTGRLIVSSTMGHKTAYFQDCGWGLLSQHNVLYVVLKTFQPQPWCRRLVERAKQKTSEGAGRKERTQKTRSLEHFSFSVYAYIGESSCKKI